MVSLSEACHSVQHLSGPTQAALHISPGVDEVLRETDASRGAGDGDLAVGRAVHRISDLDLGTRHLPDLIDLGPLAADDAPNKLKREREGK